MNANRVTYGIITLFCFSLSAMQQSPQTEYRLAIQNGWLRGVDGKEAGEDQERIEESTMRVFYVPQVPRILATTYYYDLLNVLKKETRESRSIPFLNCEYHYFDYTLGKVERGSSDEQTLCFMGTFIKSVIAKAYFLQLTTPPASGMYIVTEKITRDAVQRVLQNIRGNEQEKAAILTQAGCASAAVQEWDNQWNKLKAYLVKYCPRV